VIGLGGRVGNGLADGASPGDGLGEAAGEDIGDGLSGELGEGLTTFAVGLGSPHPARTTSPANPIDSAARRPAPITVSNGIRVRSVIAGGSFRIAFST